MAYNQSRQDSSGTLKTTISLGRTPAIVHSGPFYLMKEPPEPSEITGSTNLINHHRLNNTYTKLSGKKKNELSAFLHQPTDVNVSVNNTLKSLLESRIISNKEIIPMNATQRMGFRLLAVGQMPLQYRLFNQVHKKHKKHKKKQRNQPLDPVGESSNQTELADPTLVEKKKKDKKKEKKKDKKDKKDKKKKTHDTDQAVI